MVEEENNIINLIDEDGEEHEFAFVDSFEFEDNKYAVLLPQDESCECDEEHDEECCCEDAEAIIFRIETDENGEDVLVDIEDDAEFDRITAYLDSLMEEDEE